MAIPEGQLETWSHRGQFQQFTDTYEIINRALEDNRAPFYGRQFEVFLQGSYRNNTNVHGDSDVDVVVCQTSSFLYNLDRLTPVEKSNFAAAFPTNTDYPLATFKAEVTAWLKKQFGDREVQPGKKALCITGNGSRRDADVLICTEYHDYCAFGTGEREGSFYPGVKFFTSENVPIINYPKLHIENCKNKHQATNEWFKPTARIFKNMRNRLIRQGLLAEGVAPSYYIEGLLSNVDNGCFGTSYEGTIVSCFNWMRAVESTRLTCANGIRPLVLDNRLDSWPTANYSAFLDAIAYQWKHWGN
jgi:hypothetical protein